MKLKFTESWKFSENGHSYSFFEKDNEYSVSDSCGLSALQDGVAIEVKPEKKSATPSTNKNKGNSPKNKQTR